MSAIEPKVMLTGAEAREVLEAVALGAAHADRLKDIALATGVDDARLETFRHAETVMLSAVRLLSQKISSRDEVQEMLDRTIADVANGDTDRQLG